MAEKRKTRRNKRRLKYVDPDTGEANSYLEPDHRTVTIAHWRSSGMSAPDIAKQLNISEQTVYNELKVMEHAQKASSNPDALRAGLMALYPKAVRAVSEDMDLEESGPLAMNFLKGVGALMPEMTIDNRYLNITGPELATQFVQIIASNPELLLATKQAIGQLDSQPAIVAGPDNLPPAVQAERLRRQEERKKHALLAEGYTPETQAGDADIQEGSTLPVGAQNRLFDRVNNEQVALDSIPIDVSRETFPEVVDSQGFTNKGGHLSDGTPLESQLSESRESLLQQKAELESKLERLEADPADKEQVKRVELKIRPGEETD